MADVFIAYEYPDPWASRMIDADTDFERLCNRLADKKVLATPYGPVIYQCAQDQDPQQVGRPIARWAGAAGVVAINEERESDGLMRSVTHFVLEFLT